MHFLSSHVFTPAALIIDDAYGAVIPSGNFGDRCTRCDVPSDEHVDQVVLASYAAAVQSGAAVHRTLSCGHRGPLMTRTSTIWRAPHRGLRCDTCSGTSAIAEYVEADQTAA